MIHLPSGRDKIILSFREFFRRIAPAVDLLLTYIKDMSFYRKQVAAAGKGCRWRMTLSQLQAQPNPLRIQDLTVQCLKELNPATSAP
jgi:hypothetical protein